MKYFPNYSISSHGRVRNNKTNETVDPVLSHGSIYNQVKLKRDFESATCRIDLLVAVAFKSNLENKPILEHIDEDITNNHVRNSRWVDYDHQNKGITSISTSGFRGVTYVKQGMYTTSIKIGGKTIRLGSFYIAVDASKAYKAKTKELHG